MKEYMISSNTGKLESAVSQEREARADERYKKHIDKLAEAVRQEAELSWEKLKSKYLKNTDWMRLCKPIKI